MISISPELPPYLTEAMGRRDKQKLTIRRIILDAAHKLVAAVGPRAFTVVEVARRSGIARTTIYKYFGHKAGLLFACREELAQRGSANLAWCTAAARERARQCRSRGESRLSPTLEAVRQALLALAQHLETESDLFLLTAAEGIRSQRPPRQVRFGVAPRPLPHRFFRVVLDLLTEARAAGKLKASLEPHVVADWLAALWWHHLCLRGPLSDKKPREHVALAGELERFLGALSAA